MSVRGHNGEWPGKNRLGENQPIHTYIYIYIDGREKTQLAGNQQMTKIKARSNAGHCETYITYNGREKTQLAGNKPINKSNGREKTQLENPTNWPGKNPTGREKTQLAGKNIFLPPKPPCFPGDRFFSQPAGFFPGQLGFFPASKALSTTWVFFPAIAP